MTGHEKFMAVSQVTPVRNMTQQKKGTEMRSTIAFIVGLSLAFSAVEQAAAEVTVWNGHRYESVYVPNRLDWNSANYAAIARGGYLATITSEEENQIVFSLVDSPEFWTVGGNPFGPWIGGYQPWGSPEPYGNWRWTVTDEPWSYSNWDPGEPSDTEGTENALSFIARSWGARSDKWNDLPGYFVLPGYVVESIPEPSSAVLLGIGAVGLVACAVQKRRRG